MRIPNVTTIQSQNLFSDLANNHMLDSNNYVSVLPDTILQRYTNNPSQFPGLNALTPNQKLEALNEISTCYADHQFYSDFNALSLKFLKNPCDTTSVLSTAIENIFSSKSISVFPNPATSEIFIRSNFASEFEIEILNTFGVVVLKIKNQSNINISSLPSGIYFVRAKNGKNILTQKLIKL